MTAPPMNGTSAALWRLSIRLVGVLVRLVPGPLRGDPALFDRRISVRDSYHRERQMYKECG